MFGGENGDDNNKDTDDEENNDAVLAYSDFWGKLLAVTYASSV